jgi:hypothetical protein
MSRSSRKVPDNHPRMPGSVFWMASGPLVGSQSESWARGSHRGHQAVAKQRRRRKPITPAYGLKCTDLPGRCSRVPSSPSSILSQYSWPWSPPDLQTNDRTLAFRPTHNPPETRRTGRHHTRTAQMMINLLWFRPKIPYTTRCSSAQYRPRFHRKPTPGHGTPVSAFMSHGQQVWLFRNRSCIGHLRSVRPLAPHLQSAIDYRRVMRGWVLAVSPCGTRTLTEGPTPQRYFIPFVPSDTPVTPLPTSRNPLL